MLHAVFQYAEGFYAASKIYLNRMVSEENVQRELRSEIRQLKAKIKLLSPEVSF